MTRSSEIFIESLPKGSFYVLSREGHGFGFSGETAEQARKLTNANFKLIHQRMNSNRDGESSDSRQ
jgi:hypothetical protein